MRPRNIFLTLRKILRFACANYKGIHFNIFYSFFFIFHAYLVIFNDIFAFFLAQNFKTKVLTAQKKSTFRMSVEGVLFSAHFFFCRTLNNFFSPFLIVYIVFVHGEGLKQFFSWYFKYSFCISTGSVSSMTSSWLRVDPSVLEITSI